MKEKAALEKNANSHIRANFSHLLDENQDISVTATTVEDGLGSLVATLEWPLPSCKRTIKVSRTNERWNASNYYGHLKSHPSKRTKAATKATSHITNFLMKEDSGGGGEKDNEAAARSSDGDPDHS